jgi:3-hydroxyacyl-CoA dehydrogenase
VGAGTIGSGWLRLFERARLDVRLHDPARADSLPLADAVAGAGWVQESGPEDLAAKQALFAELDRLAPPDAILASSTSALPMTRIARDVERPERCVVAHPTNPPDVVPLVEVVAGERTSQETVRAAVEFLRGLGQAPIVLRREVHGFVLNRLQMAVLREALHLHRAGVASAADIDRAVTEGLALRWAFLGPFAVEHTNAGSLAEDFVRFGVVIGELFASLSTDISPPGAGDVERLNSELDEITGGKDHAELTAYRDRMVRALRELKSGSR